MHFQATPIGAKSSLNLEYPHMNFSNVLRAEITRQAKRSLKADLTDVTKKLNAQRKEIAGLKRYITELTRQVKMLGGF
jgi:polyhydroxyalkanoate synthesis regulator phasin